MATLEEGKAAPDFELPSSEGKAFKLSDLRGKKNVVLYFYPKDNTPGCTQESCDFRDRFPKIEKLDTAVYGISADSLASHERFRSKYQLSFPLLSDEDKKVLKSYGVWKEKSLYGHKFMGIERTTVIIDKKGNVSRIFPKVKVKGHAEEVLASLKSV